MTCLASNETALNNAEGCASPREFYFCCRECGHLIRMKLGCGQRFSMNCPECSKKWQRSTSKRYFKGVLNMKNAQFLTLTLRKYTDYLCYKNTMQARLMRLWEFRKALFFKLRRKLDDGEPAHRIDGWCAIIEPPNHVHIIVDCDYIKESELSGAWYAVTGDSFIVDLRPIKITDEGGPRKVMNYIVKYMTKAANWTGMNLDLLKSFHLIGSSGLDLGERKPFSFCSCGYVAQHPLRRLDYLDYRAALTGPYGYPPTGNY